MKQLYLLVLLLISSLVAWAGADAPHSLRGDVALDSPSVTTLAKEWSVDKGKIIRNYNQQPPLIPHDIEDFAITRDENSCLMCHSMNSEMAGATKVAVSHFLNRDDEALLNISPRRYFCTQCHVPQRDTKPLVMNNFKSLLSDD